MISKYRTRGNADEVERGQCRKNKEMHAAAVTHTIDPVVGDMSRVSVVAHKHSRSRNASK